VFAVDVTVCPHCAGRMRLVTLATTREEISKALTHAGLGPRPPLRARPMMLGQLELPLRRCVNAERTRPRRKPTEARKPGSRRGCPGPTGERGSRRSVARVARVARDARWMRGFLDLLPSLDVLGTRAACTRAMARRYRCQWTQRAVA
jgi:hypothetical protein